jgi:DNA-binding NarL/FixJ family response regulator
MTRDLAIPLHKITPRGRDVFRALLTGKSLARICSDLDLDISTLHKHATRIYKDLGVGSRQELMALFVVAPPESAFEAPEFKAPWQV